MTGSSEILKTYAEKMQAHLRLAVERWLKSTMTWSPKLAQGSVVGKKLTLPLETDGTTLKLRKLRECFPKSLRTIADANLQKSVHRQLALLAAETLALDDQLLSLLSELATETALHRIIINPADRFEVGPYSVLMSLAWVNVLAAHAKYAKHLDEAIQPTDLQPITEPLDMILELEVELQPGDFWIGELIAGSMWTLQKSVPARRAKPAKTGPKAAAEPPYTWRKSLASLTPHVISTSMLFKLLSAHQITAEVAKRCRYRSWPGLPQLLGDPGADGLRHMLVGELAHCVVEDKVGLARAALVRFLQSVTAVEDPVQHLHARLLIAQLFWEMLEQDADILRVLVEQKSMSGVLLPALRAIEVDTSAEDLPDDFATELRRLHEIRALCLRVYEEYASLTALVKSMSGSTNLI